MTKPHKSPIAALTAMAASFGPEAATEKARLLDLILEAERFSAADLARLLDAVCFLLAYPDSPSLLDQVRQVASRLRDWGPRVRGGGTDAVALTDIGFPGANNYYEFALPVIAQMQRANPGCLEMDWRQFAGSAVLQNCLGLYVAPAECAGLDSIHLSMQEWVAAAKDPGQTDLEFFVAMFSAPGPGPIAAEILWDSCQVMIRYHLRRSGTGRPEIFWPIDRVHYQRRGIKNQRIPLAKAIRTPLELAGPLAATRGRAFIDFSLASLCARNLEIRMLMYSSATDVHLVDCGRGVQVALVGVVPDYRDALECNYCSLVLKNGIMIAYGPVSVHFGRCEMGLNLFPEYRSGEIRWVYPQFMRAIHHVLGAHYFFLTSYGMGDGNPDAIRSGAFWFYRKLGFLAVEPAVEALAQAEEEKIRQQPGYRSSPSTLRRLAPTEAYFEISGDTPEAFDLAAIGVRISRLIAADFAGDRPTAESTWIRRVVRVLELPGRRSAGVARALRLFAPLLCVIDGFAQWSQTDRKRMRRIILAKGGASEATVDRLLSEHSAFRSALRSLARPLGV